MSGASGGPPRRLTPLSPVEERFLRTAPGAPQVLATAVVVVDGAALRGPDGVLDRAALLDHLREWGASDPRMTVRLVPSPTGLVPPAWAPSTAVFDRAVAFSTDPFRLADLDGVAAELQLAPLDLSVAPVHATVLDDPSGPVALVIRGHHAWTDGAFGRTVVERLLAPESGPLRSPATAAAGRRPPRADALLPWLAPVLLLRQWWDEQPGAREAARAWAARPLSGRVRRFLGRHRWALSQHRSSRPAPREGRGVRRVELQIDDVRGRARLLGGNINDLLAVATARAVAGASPTTASPVQHVLVPMSERAADGRVRSNMVRVVSVAVDLRLDEAENVRAAGDQLRAEGSAPPAPPRAAPPAHATTMVGTRHQLHLGPAPVRQYALLPSLGEAEEAGVLALVQRRTVVVSVVTRDPALVDGVTARLCGFLTGAAVAR